ncbi:MAG: hypothetical protein KDD25_02790, partial [Bdellovibrionales bacterium]|nr:hypothetical protein [Bdellovibrionales bacterium]
LKSTNTKASDSIGKTTGKVQVAKTVNVPVLAYGITNWWTSALVVPVATTDVKVDTGFVKSSNGNRFHDYIATQDYKRRTAEEMRKKTTDAINYSATDKNYDKVEGFTETEIADVVLVNKFKGIESKRWNLGYKQTLTLPTGRELDTNRVIDAPSGDGQWDVGIGAVTEYMPLARDSWKIVLATGYTFQLPDYGSRRIPESSDSKLSEDIDDDTRFDLGDIFYAQLGTKIGIAPGFGFVLGSSYQHKEADKFNGGKYNSRRYSILDEDTEEEMTSALAGLSYSTIPFFKQKSYAVPWEMGLSYAKILAGRNINRADLLQFEMAMFF